MDRRGSCSRSTSETDVEVLVKLDTPRPPEVGTTVPFLDHMLKAMAVHAGLGLRIEARGDLEVDAHHLVEDCGIALGRALRDALEDCAVARAGWCAMPMDESLVLVAVDLSGRPALGWSMDLSGLDDLPLSPLLFRELMRGLAANLPGAIHVRAMAADSGHHVVEAAFKGLGRALAMAMTPASLTLSTKGVIDA